MQIIHDTTEFHMDVGSAVAIGKFDGVHRGHEMLLSCILEKKKQGMKAVVFTFHPSAAVYFGQTSGGELTTREEKRSCFERLGVDTLIEFPLNKETAATSPEDFVREILVKRMNTAFVAAGRDLSFGRGGKGDSRLLEKMALHPSNSKSDDSNISKWRYPKRYLLLEYNILLKKETPTEYYQR